VAGACWLHPIFFGLIEFIPPSTGGALFAPPGVALKKKRLADHR
jgi:hypothetical protein